MCYVCLLKAVYSHHFIFILLGSRILKVILRDGLNIYELKCLTFSHTYLFERVYRAKIILEFDINVKKALTKDKASYVSGISID